MSNRQFALFAAFIIPLIFTVSGSYSINDLAVWIVHGSYFLDHHELLRQDIFSVLPTKPLVYPAWGISVIYALIYRATGLLVVCWFHSALAVFLLWLIYRKSIALLPNPGARIARFSTYFFWLGGAAALGPRPSMVALIPLVLAFFEIEEIESLSDLTPKRIAKLCLLNIVWVNIHGSFVLLWMMLIWKTGFLNLAEWKSSRRNFGVPRQIAAHLCIGLSALINPFTYHILPYVLETMRSSQTRRFSEWEPTTPFAHFPTGLLFWILVVAVAVEIFRRRKSPDFLPFLSSPFFLLFLNGFSAVRNAAIPLFVLLPKMKELGFLDSDQREDPEVRRPRASNLLKAGFFASLVVLVPLARPLLTSVEPPRRRQIFDNTAIPLIVEKIRESGKTCPIFNADEVGGFLLLMLPNRIFFDARNIIYSDEEFDRYLRAFRAEPGWQGYLEKYHTCLAVLDETIDAPLIQAMRSDHEWKFVLEEKGNFLFEKI